MSCTDTHSSREWKLCSPAKRFGVGSPMNDSREPSVPPRIGRVADVEAGAADRLARVLDDDRVLVEHLLHVAVRLLDLRTRPRAGTPAHDLPRERLDPRFLLLQPRGHEVAHQQLDRWSCRRSAWTTYGWTKPSCPSVVSGDRRSARQPRDERRRQLDGVHHPALRVARMRVEAVEGDGHGVGGEALDLELAARAAVHRVGAVGAEPRHVEVLRAARRPLRPA